MENTLTQVKTLSWLHRTARNLLLKALAQLPQGHLQLIEGDQQWQFGDRQHPVQATIEVKQADFYWQVLRYGSIGAGEAYIQGYWDSPETHKVIELFAINLDLLDRLESYFNWFSKPMQRISHLLNANSIQGSKKNILAHYDVGNAMYQLFLDPSMLYSSAIYPTPATSLEQAQQYKLQQICERLELKAGMHLLEIGTGWGALALYAARHYGVQVTTTTISDAQHDYAQARIIEAGLTEQITLLKQDYRLLTGQYDRIVSIEMIEAVGHEYLPNFFERLGALLKPQGKLLIQAITIADRRYESYRSGVDFIQKYIFPGGCLPSVSRMSHLLSEQGRLQLLNLWDFGLDYAQTLADWRGQFLSNLSAIKQLGYGEDFIRMWLFYLYYCEGGFRARTTSVVHLLASKA